MIGALAKYVGITGGHPLDPAFCCPGSPGLCCAHGHRVSVAAAGNICTQWTRDRFVCKPCSVSIRSTVGGCA